MGRHENESMRDESPQLAKLYVVDISGIAWNVIESSPFRALAHPFNNS
jgi:hypothetical protein